MIKRYRVTCVGVSPLIMSRCPSENPLNHISNSNTPSSKRLFYINHKDTFKSRLVFGVGDKDSTSKS